MADAATGGLAAGAIDGTGRSRHEGHGGACLNCGTALVGPHCHRCGQTAHIHRTASGLFHDIAHGVFHFEGRTWHTLPLLFWRPGEVTRRYIQGERVNFVSPMALFLFSVFLMVAVFGVLGGPFGPLNTGDVAATAKARTDAANELKRVETEIRTLKARKDALKAQGRSDPKLNEQLGDLISDEAGLRLVTKGILKPNIKSQPIDIEEAGIKTGVPGVDHVIQHAADNPELAAYKLQSSAYKFSWALIPISLPFIWLLFAFRRDVGMYDHAIFATYSLSAMTLMVVALSIGAALGLWGGAIAAVLLLFPPWHMYRQLKGAYGLGRFGALWRTFALIISAYTAALIFFIFLLTMGA
ncbi:DUF3667 domain-containing protein [Rhizorhabdus dicambivorans]|uniref:DUF3667 domain-containing protein n=2 Tax=Rhizorhabdus dicambivorans TaxID=1850238 RepID=A0A2A4FY92_9SPHN|nr:DUF3667 domain-containing protein [Rhizorhabdus dicambivorans]PCE43754.1 DUF3667 domain-containing protein [Rhizorhabdus dicambivorans]